jgi:site-specific DNA-methyltransferase (adenine-specific)
MLNHRKPSSASQVCTSPKERAPRNRTITISPDIELRLNKTLLALNRAVCIEEIVNRVICQDTFSALSLLPNAFAQLVIVDPPYNRNKTYNSSSFTKVSERLYEEWINSWMVHLARIVHPKGSIYICCDWQSSTPIYHVAQQYFQIRNRITWEREKGRGAKANWKNNSEDIWFCTASNDYHFDAEAVKLKRRVIAPYRHASGAPKDWVESNEGSYRMTHPSNLWTDITVPFWSMPENTDHPTQKPEKLIAKLVLASSRPGDIVFDPFAGVGTTPVVAKKLGRRHLSIEVDRHYCCLAQMRIEFAAADPTIQGYTDGIFWERNTLSQQVRSQFQREPNDKSVQTTPQIEMFSRKP